MRKMFSPIPLMLAGVVLVSSSSTMAQSPGVLASAERFLADVELEQNETFVQRRRSGALAATGAVLAATGVVLVLQPPKCSLQGSATETRDLDFVVDTIAYDVIEDSGYCDLRAVYESRYEGSMEPFGYVLYESESPEVDFGGRNVTTNRTLNHIGWGALAAGGALVWFGLTRVEVPFRLDVGTGRRVAVVRSFSW
ncbi:MAG: hypothetical protein OXG35_16895 [Acidobacteria bacterium]|nr:hypothetical protein [Acidobacteriota bacterium]